MANEKSGFTELEEEIHLHLMQANDKFQRLKQTHPDDVKQWHQAIHTMQHTLGMRILRRDYPHFWVTLVQCPSCLGKKGFDIGSNRKWVRCTTCKGSGVVNNKLLNKG